MVEQVPPVLLGRPAGARGERTLCEYQVADELPDRAGRAVHQPGGVAAAHRESIAGADAAGRSRLRVLRCELACWAQQGRLIDYIRVQ